MAISEEDHQRIAEAVARAEAGTTGEIRCVLAAQIGNPWVSALVAGGLAALVAPPVALALGLRPDFLAEPFQGWSAAHATAGQARDYAVLTVYIGLQSLVFALVAGAMMTPGIRRFFTPASWRAAKVHKAAVEQFEALGLTHTQARTGVLLFASLSDRRAEVLADTGVYSGARPDAWQAVVDALVSGLAKDQPADGFVAAVDAAGVILHSTLPSIDGGANELPDRLVTR